LSRLQSELGTGIETQRELAQFRGRLQNSDQKYEILQKSIKEMDNKITGWIQLSDREMREREEQRAAGGSENGRPEFPPLPDGQASEAARDDLCEAPVQRTNRFSDANSTNDSSVSDAGTGGAASQPGVQLSIEDLGEGYSSLESNDSALSQGT